jgi:outer membrane protein
LPAMASAQPAITLPAPPFTFPFVPAPSGDWTVTIGGEGKLGPAFEGAKQYTVSPVPIFSIQRTGTPVRFRSPRDSASIALFDFGGFRAGPALRIIPARTASSYSALNGLSNVNLAVELGGFAEYFPVDWFRTRVEVREAFGGINGLVADVNADFIVPVLERFTVSGGPRFTWESTGATAPYFSVTPAQAIGSGLSVYDASGGPYAAGAGAQLRYQFNPQWEVHSYVEYDRLLGSVAASPLVTTRGSPNQLKVGIGASYSFDVRVR